MIPQHNGRDGRPLDHVPRKPVEIGSAAFDIGVSLTLLAISCALILRGCS